jgi:hypothetical protein
MILPQMTDSEIQAQIRKIASPLNDYALAKLDPLVSMSERKRPSKARSHFTVDNNECSIFYFPWLKGYTLWVKYRRNRQVAGKIWKEYPLFATIIYVDSDPKKGEFPIEVLHFRKHALDRYKERRELKLTGIDDILEEISYSDMDLVRDYKDIDNDLQHIFLNSPNGLFLGTFVPSLKFTEIYTFITNDMMYDDQFPELDDDIFENVEDLQKILGKDYGNILSDIIQVIKNQ